MSTRRPQKESTAPRTFAEVKSVPFRDGFSDTRSGWATGTVDGASVRYADGQLRLDIDRAGVFVTSSRAIAADDAPLHVVHVQAHAMAISRAGGGVYGVTCAADVANYYAFVVQPSGGHAIVRVVEGRGTVLMSRRGRHPGLTKTGPNRIDAECVAHPGAPTRLVLRANGTPIAAVHDDRFDGFTRVGLYAEALPEADSFSAAFDDVVVRSVAGSPARPQQAEEPFPNPLEQVLLEHVPHGFRATCTRAGAPAADALADLECRPSRGADVVRYAQYPSPEAMDEHYQEIVASLGGTSNEGDCAGTWPAEGPYAVDGRAVGRVWCGRTRHGAVIRWTDERLDIIAAAVRRDSRQRELHAFWVSQAGPQE